MSTPNNRKKLTEGLLGTTYEREDLMRQEVRARCLARRRRREERSAEGAQRGSLVSKLGRAISSGGGVGNPHVSWGDIHESTRYFAPVVEGLQARRRLGFGAGGKKYRGSW
jgi:hypothetical protein